MSKLIETSAGIIRQDCIHLLDTLVFDYKKAANYHQ